MKRIYLIISFTFILFASKAYSMDLYDEQEKNRMDEINKKIVTISITTAAEASGVSGLYLTGQWVAAMFLGGKVAYDVNELVDLIKEKISLTKDAKERRDLEKSIEDLKSVHGMDEYRENHSDEHGGE